jgi:glycosyltransferase involved in cell wall biosynthesis
MAGPAIRCVEIAKQLAREHEVTVFSPQATDFKNSSELCDSKNFNLFCQAGKSQLYRLAQNQDILFIQANVLKPYPGLAELGKYIVVDLYDPFMLAVLAQFAVDSVSATASYRMMHQVLKKHMVNADFSVCASEKQLDYWMGRFCAIGRLTPEMYGFDRSFRKLIDVVPFGLPDAAPIRTGQGLKGKVPGISENDFLLVWGGGIWEWFDPLTIIEAVARLAKSHPQLKLYFMGYQSPNPQVGLMQMAVKAKELAANLGVLDKHVFFSDSWTAYEDRVNCLLDANVAVSAHFDLPETRFSFRTRILDYLWAGLPILSSKGDELAEQIEREGAGMALPYQNVDSWVE